MSAHRREVLFGSLFAAGALGAAGRSIAQQAAPTPKRAWVCPPCGCAADGKVFDAPGLCPDCGMPLVERTAQSDTRRKVAILVFPGVQIIDFAAPMEVFGQAGYAPFLVAVDRAPLRTNMGLTVTPAHSFDDCPAPDILMIPGGGIDTALRSPQTLGFLKAKAAEARHVMTVCNGAMIAAQAGILEGLKATTYYGAIEDLRRGFPNVTVVSDQRFVDNGKVVTSAGLSAGIDAALHLVSRISGPAQAQLVALNMEYDWKADGTYARAAFADYPLRQMLGTNLNLAGGALESTAGDRKTWAAVWRMEAIASPEAAANAIAAAIAARGGPAARTSGAGRRTWRFVDNRSRAWRLDLSVTEAAGVKRARITSRLAT